MPYGERLLGVLLMTFCVRSVIGCFRNMYIQHH